MARKYRHFVYDEKQRFIYPTSDWGFKYLFGTEQNKDLLLGLLQELLPELGIESVTYLPRDVTIPIGKTKTASFDVFCELKNKGRAIIEMQNYARNTFLDRASIYTAEAILENYVNSAVRGYSIGKTIFIAFVGDSLFYNTKRTPIRLSMCDIDEPMTVVRYDKVLQIFVELPKFAGSLETIDDSTPFVEKLAYVLMEMADCKDIPQNLSNPLLEKIFQAADTSVMSSNTKEDYLKAMYGEADYEYHMMGAHAEGRAEGRAEGKAEGRAEGLEEAKVEVARRMKEMGLSIDTISEVVGLAPDQILNL